MESAAISILPLYNNIHVFTEFIYNEFDKSAIKPSLYKNTAEIVSEVEETAGHDAILPIHEALNWKHFVRFSHQVKEHRFACLFINENQECWQAIIGEYDEEKDRNYKYLAPTENGDRAFLPTIPKDIRLLVGDRHGVKVPLEGSFWEWVAQNKNIPIIITEGAKKALALLSRGYVAIALYGCSCGGKTELIPDLKPFLNSGRTWLFAFDRDEKASAKRAVTMGKNRLRKLLIQDDIKTYIEDIVWSTEDGKGADDLIANKGGGAFDVAYGKAISRLEKQFATGAVQGRDDDDKIKPPSQIKVAREIAEKYRSLLAFNNQIGCWMRYSADNIGMWSRETNECIESIIHQIMISEGHDNFTSSFVSSVVKLLRNELIERTWNEKPPTEYLPFKNGVLEITTGKLLEHAPGYKLTWQLPRNHEIGGSWENINKFLEHLSSGNEKIKDLLLCYCNAVIKGRADLQRFLHLIGLGGTGKGTFARLIASLIGSENIHTTSLEEWCKDKFEPANAYRKRLVIFPDEDRQGGKIGKFLSLTGEDYLRAEEKHKTAFKFKYDGMVLVMSNLPIFGGEAASRVKRRVITIPCNNVVAPSQRKNMDKIFEDELPAFTNYILGIKDSHVTNILRGIEDIPEITLEFWENRMRVDSIAAWINQNIVYDPDACTPVGMSRHEGSDGSEIQTLFGSYSRHCHNLGDSPKSHKNFSPDLLELCKSVLNWPVEKVHSNTGKFIRGIRLRNYRDDGIPTYDVYLSNQVTVGDGSSDGSSDGSEPLLYKESDGSDGSSDGLEEKLQDLSGCDSVTVGDGTIATEDNLTEEIAMMKSAIAARDVETIALYKDLPHDAKSIIFHALTIEEQRILVELKNPKLPSEIKEEEAKRKVKAIATEILGDLATPKPVDGVPVFEVGNIVLVKGKLFRISKVKPSELEGAYKGDPFTEKINFCDAVACAESKISTIGIGDTIKPLSGRDKGKKMTVTSLDSNMIYAKPGKGMAKGFYAHQVEKIAN